MIKRLRLTEVNEIIQGSTILLVEPLLNMIIIITSPWFSSVLDSWHHCFISVPQFIPCCKGKGSPQAHLTPPLFPFYYYTHLQIFMQLNNPAPFSSYSEHDVSNVPENSDYKVIEIMGMVPHCTVLIESNPGTRNNKKTGEGGGGIHDSKNDSRKAAP
ncbi:hypothetical protein BCR42DRAFT_386021 [Absidia repens]|uniref:Uncharacterized protein n=1 Tax=Absidia repens TaxID=90262 RepID=A0A1X2J0R1_9FUNG|nr:hypothetical protein BCR42DRAFT_386021 [Absidia repens]